MDKLTDFKSLTYKIGAPTILVCVIVFAIMVFFFRQENTEFIRNKIDNEISHIENTLNIALEGQSSIGNFRRVVNALGSGKSIDRLVLIEESSGIILADTINQNLGKKYIDIFPYNELLIIRESVESKDRIILSYSNTDFVADHINLVDPKVNRLRPFLVLLTYDKTIDIGIANQIFFKIILALSLGLLALLFLAFLVQYYVLLKPLGKIISTFKNQANSDQLLTIDANSKDEIGVLAKYCDNMSRQKIFKDAELHKLSLRMEVAIDATKLGVFEYDVHTDTHIWNSHMYIILGLDENSFKPDNDNWYVSVHPEDQAAVKTKLFDAVKTGISFSHEYRLIKDSTTITTVRTFVQTVSDDQGKTVHTIGTLLDITAQKMLSKQREDALIKAEESARLRSEFLASVSHEIRTPMNGVIGMIELLGKSNLNEKQTQYAKLAKNSAESLLHLINDILDFSKMDAGKMEIDNTEFDIFESFGDCIDSLAIKAQEKDIELILDTSSISHPNLVGDPGRLRQILINLISNAIKFTETGEVIVSAETKETKEGKVELCCDVSDSGIGISSQNITALFDSFTQIDASTTEKFGGTGLGLAIVKQLCELMEGTVSINSKLGEGTRATFNVTFSENKKIPLAKPTIDFNSEKVLIVDGNLACREILTKQLLLGNTKIESVADGYGALQAIENTYYSHVLIGANLSDMSSFKLAERIRSNSAYDKATLVLLNKLVDSHILEDSCNIDFNFSISKPLTYYRLLNAFGTSITEENRCDLPLKIDATTPDNSVTYKLLLVEDNSINQKVILGILEDLDLDISVANNGAEALELLAYSKEYFEIILMDCQMPVLDGFETTEHIRQGNLDHNAAHYKNIPIIAVTANAIVGQKEKCFEVGMDAFLTKPIDSQQLIEVVQQYLPSLSTEAEPHNPLGELFMDTNDKEDSAGSNIWDRDLVLQRMRGKEDRLKMLIDLFLTNTPPLIVEAEGQANHSSNSELAKTAHAIKGSAGNISGLQLCETANKLELAALSNTQEDIDKLVLDLSEQYQVLAGILQKESHPKSASI